ncbi:Tetratricopeptide repeat protein [Azospirillaceae bacterium]
MSTTLPSDSGSRSNAPSVADLLQQAFALHRAGQLKEAVQGYIHVLKLDPNNVDALHLSGLVLRASGKNPDAEKMIRRAIALRPTFVEAHYNLGNTLSALGKVDEAIESYEHAISLQPDHTTALYNLGNLHRNQGKFDDAVACFQKAVKYKPSYAEAWHNLANVFKEMGEIILAVEIYRKTLSLVPDLAEAHYNLGLSLMALGQFEEGFREYEWRWKVDTFPSPKRNFSQPQWDGSAFPGRCLLVHAEQGLGDVIQFCRYLPMLPSRSGGGRVMLECLPSQMGLLGRLEGVDAVVPAGQPLPPFDLQVPILSLPFIFKTSLETIPNACPYLTPNPERVSLWRNRMGEQQDVVRIGLVWAGNPRHGNDKNRSLSLRQFFGLPMQKMIKYYSLQKDKAAEEINQFGLSGVIPDLGKDIKDFEDLTAVISILDLLITVDSAPAHVAGGLGKLVWTLLPFSADWRWMTETSESPWYPTMTLYRQSQAGAWDDVLARIVTDIAGVMAAINAS